MIGRRLVLLALVVLSAGACGDDDDDTKGAAADRGDRDACEVVRELSDLDDEFQGEINEAMGPLVDESDADPEASFDRFRDVMDRMEDEADTLVELYVELEAALDGELAASARTLGAFTDELIDELGAIESFEELESLAELFAGERSRDAVQATFRLDEWSRDRCDVVLAD